MYIYQTINILIMITLITLSYLDTGKLAITTILPILFIGNNILLIRTNNKQVEKRRRYYR
ncbi:hypothetical protein DOS77_10810 [Staphylococcus felis]|nr:hypothetical protein DOS57_07885 [Staphylococcus felis]REI03282.1 hypothetical protein DOS65_04955 [Staphylococcus felis]REI11945.1 hypothetical protein DOS66_03185 [Staphylococcus felis]REI17312.1 hypothetical protein DOS73_01745 [Staphylococcus felis]REI20097.1 hypothetical protein DOS77_10810 [Staphylococcus felis]